MAVEIDPKALEALLEDLDRGVVGVGLHEDNDTELFDVDGATETMFEAAQLIRALRPSPSSDERVKVHPPEALSDFLNTHRTIEEKDEPEYHRLLAENDAYVGSLDYCGNTVSYIKSKADNYGRQLGEAHRLSGAKVGESVLDRIRDLSLAPPGDERVDLRDSVIEDRDARQQQVADWCAAAFGAEHQASVPQRGLRFLEEAIEAFQAIDGDPAQAHKLIDYIFAKEPGELFQELGGVGVTLLALGAAAKLSVDKAERTEIARVLSKPLEHFWARNKVKNDAGFDALAYPSGGALQPHKGE